MNYSPSPGSVVRPRFMLPSALDPVALSQEPEDLVRSLHVREVGRRPLLVAKHVFASGP